MGELSNLVGVSGFEPEASWTRTAALGVVLFSVSTENSNSTGAKTALLSPIAYNFDTIIIP